MSPLQGRGHAVTYQYTLILSAFPQAYDIAHDDLGDGHESAASDARERAEYGQLKDTLCQRGCEGPDKEDGEADQEAQFSACDVA